MSKQKTDAQSLLIKKTGNFIDPFFLLSFFSAHGAKLIYFFPFSEATTKANKSRPDER